MESNYSIMAIKLVIIVKKMLFVKHKPLILTVLVSASHFPNVIEA